MVLRKIYALVPAIMLCVVFAGCATMGTEAHLKKSKGQGPITDTINANRRTLEACITQSISLNTGEGVRMILRFTLTAQGRVKNLEMEAISAPDPDFSQCVLKKIRRLEFPPTESGLDEPVRYPLVFSQSEG